MNKHSIRNLALGGAAAISAVGVLGGTLVHAQSPSPTTTPGATSTQQTPMQRPDQGAYIDSLAQNLGITSDALKAALKKTALDQVAAKLASGQITAAQATEMTARIEADAAAGRFGFGAGGPRGGGPGGPGGHDGRGMRQDPAALATFFGITVEQLRTEQQSGKTLAEIATAHGKTRDQLKAFLTTEAQTNLAQAVADGKMTQAEADQKLQEMTANLDARIDAKGGPGRPAGGPRGGMQPTN